MRLSGIDFKPIWDAPGVRGWTGEGYWHHHLPFYRGGIKALRDGSTFVAKTTTLDANTGRMPFLGKEHKFKPQEWFPACVMAEWRTKRTFNAIGLSGPGFLPLVGIGLLERSEPYMISFMPVRKTPEARVEETRQFVQLFIRLLDRRSAHGRIALQFNISCPNTGHDLSALGSEAISQLDQLADLAELGVPVVVKINLLTPIDVVKAIAGHAATSGIVVTNAIPFDALPDVVKADYPRGSPLRGMGGGGFSGPELLFPLIGYVRELRDAGVDLPLNVGGGIRKRLHVRWLVQHAPLRRGVDSIFIASAMIVCPWNVPSIVAEAHECLS